MRKAIFILLLAVVSSNAMAEWIKFGTVDNGNITYYLDPTTISNNGEMAQMLILQDYLTAQSDRHYLSAISQSEYDCKKEYVRPLSISLHSGNMGGGEIIEKVTARDDAWITIPANTMFANMWKLACGKK